MKLFFRKYGQGPPLIILHGLYGSSDNWVTIAGKLSGSFTVYLPDLRNHGNSPHSEIHDYGSMSEDIIEMAGDLELGKFCLAGHSMGGKVAIAVALKRPDLLSGLVIADILPYPDYEITGKALNEHKSILEAIRKTDLSTAKKREDVEEQLRSYIQAENIRALIMKNLQRKKDGSFGWKINNLVLLNNLENITGSIFQKGIDYDPISGFPVKFLKGGLSGYITDEGFRKVCDLFPGAELVVIKNAGHWIQADDPESVTSAILDLLNN